MENQNHLCPVCGKECPKHSRSTKKNPKWRTFCSDECKYSDKGKEITNKLYEESCLKKYGIKDARQSKSAKEKRKQTNKEKYGTEYPLQNKQVKDKFKETCLERYGEDNPFKLKEFKDKFKETCLERYGVNSPLQSKEIKEKHNSTIRERYGVDNVSQLDSVKKKKAKTTKEHYGVDCIFKDSNFRDDCLKKYRENHWDFFQSQLKLRNIIPLFEKDDYVNQTDKSHHFLCNKCNKEFIVEVNNTYPQKIFCNDCFKQPTSNAEQEIFNWLSSLGITNIERNKRDWNGKKGIEADIYLSDYNLAIEYNGLYWHSNLYKDSNYHYNKWKFFKDIGIDCIQIFENEWRDKKDIVKSIITNRLGLNNRIYGRKCIVKEIKNDDYMLFSESNHLQGYCNAKVRLGLYYNYELVMVMSFSKPRFNKKYDWENIRTCSKVGYNILGGFGKLLKYFKENYSGSIVSYIDSRYFSGNGYINSGFNHIGHSKPNYFYFNNDTLYNRVEFQKHKLKDKLNSFNKNLSEKENMMNNGWNWIYDCGNEIVLIKDK